MTGGPAVVPQGGSHNLQVLGTGDRRQPAAQATGTSLLQRSISFLEKARTCSLGGKIDSGPMAGRVGLGKFEGIGKGGSEEDGVWVCFGMASGPGWQELGMSVGTRGAGQPLKRAMAPCWESGLTLELVQCHGFLMRGVHVKVRFSDN